MLDIRPWSPARSPRGTRTARAGTGPGGGGGSRPATGSGRGSRTRRATPARSLPGPTMIRLEIQDLSEYFISSGSNYVEQNPEQDKSNNYVNIKNEVRKEFDSCHWEIK